MTKEDAIKELELLHVTAAAPAGSVAGESCRTVNDALDMAIYALREPPRVRAHWIEKQNPQWRAYSHDECSECGWWNTRNAKCYDNGKRGGHSLNYCPNCGAKMDANHG